MAISGKKTLISEFLNQTNTHITSVACINLNIIYLKHEKHASGCVYINYYVSLFSFFFWQKQYVTIAETFSVAKQLKFNQVTESSVTLSSYNRFSYRAVVLGGSRKRNANVLSAASDGMQNNHVHLLQT